MSSFAVRVISLSMTNMPKPLGRAKNDVSVRKFFWCRIFWNQNWPLRYKLKFFQT